MEAEFLVGRQLADRVRTICAERKVDCAVAFWGRDIRAGMFPHWDGGGVRILCDITMGCNSQAALTGLGAPENPRLRVRDRLHAKVFISAAGAVVGSCNASLNGLGMAAVDPRNLEAGTFYPPGSQPWRDAKKWFDDLFTNGSVKLGRRQLARAPEVAHDPGPRIGPEGKRSKSLLDLARSYPVDFTSTLFLGEWQKVTSGELRKEQAHYDKAERSKEFEPARRTLIISASDDHLPEFLPNALMWWSPDKRSTWELCAYTDVVPVHSKTSVALWGVSRPWRSYWRDRAGMAPNRNVSEVDQDFVKSINKGSWAMTASALSEEYRTFRPE